MTIEVKHKYNGETDEKDISIHKLADSNFGYIYISHGCAGEGCVLDKKDIDKIINTLTEVKNSLL